MTPRTLHNGVTECSSSGLCSHQKTMEYLHWLESRSFGKPELVYCYSKGVLDSIMKSVDSKFKY